MHKKVIIFILLIITSQNIQASEQAGSTQKFNYLGEPTPRSILVGMWTTHIWTNQFGSIQPNNLIGYIDHGLFIGTFTNSYEHRSFSAGFNRYWLSRSLSTNINLQLGYRLGLIYGYQKGEVLFSSHSPIIPFIQLISDLSWKRIGVEISTTGQVISGGFYFRF